MFMPARKTASVIKIGRRFRQTEAAVAFRLSENMICSEPKNINSIAIRNRIENVNHMTSAIVMDAVELDVKKWQKTAARAVNTCKFLVENWFFESDGWTAGELISLIRAKSDWSGHFSNQKSSISI